MKDFAIVLKKYGKNIKVGNRCVSNILPTLPTARWLTHLSIPFKNCQNQLYRSATSMTNLGMQMKILCSVKAATLETNKVHVGELKYARCLPPYTLNRIPTKYSTIS